MSQSAAIRDDLKQQLSDVEAALDGVRQTLTSQTAEVERLTRREAELTSLLTDAAATRHTLERRMADTEAALGAANERLSRERLVAVEQATERQTTFQAQLEQEIERRRSVEDLLARAETGLDEAETRHEVAMTTAAALFAERQTQLDAELTEAAAARSALGQQTHDLEAALEGARQILASHADEVERLTRREAELTSILAHATATHDTLEHRLADIETVFKDADERAAQDRLAAAERAATREADLEELIREERVTRALVEQKLAHVETAWRDAEQQLDSLERSRLAAEAEARQLAAEHTDAQRNLEEARSDFQRTLDLVSSEYADALATLVAAVTERHARLEEQAARHATSLQAAELDRSQLQDGFQTTVAARDREIEQLQNTLKATALELVGVRRRCEALQTNKPICSGNSTRVE